MADNYVTDAGAGGNTYFSDDIGGTHAPLIKIMLGALDANDGPVGTANPLPIDIQEINGTAISIGGGVEAGALLVTIASDSTGVISVDDNGGALTVDWAGTAPPIGAGVEATALRVTIATDSTGLISVDDNGGTLTVDAPVGTPVNVQIGDGTDTALVDSDGALRVDEPNMISTNNSTTATLVSAANFTGTGDDISDFSAVTIQIDASHDSATDGMTFEFSTDNSNWDDVYLFTYTAADGARRFQFPATAQYFRVNYTNGGTGQTHFRVQTILHRHAVTGTIHRIVDSMDPDRSATLVKAVVAAQAAGSGDFVPVQATAAGNFKMSLEEIDGALLGGGVEAGALLVTIANDSTGLLSVDDGGANLSVDWGGTVPPIGAGTEAAALRVTVATDSTGLLPVSVASLPLPAGAATSALQLADGHNVTVDNGAAGAAVNIQDGGNVITVDGTVVVTHPALGGGTEAGAQRVTIASDSTGVLSVDYAGSVPTISNAGMQVTGDEAHDAPDAGNPVKQGAVAIAHGTNPTAVAAADRTDLYANRAGVPFMIGGHPNVVTIRANYTAAQTDTAIVTVSAGTKIVVTRCMVTADNANTVDVSVLIGFATATTPTTTGVIAAHPGIPAGGGFVTGDGSGMLGVGADDEDLRITSQVPTTGSIDVVVTYYTIES